MKLNKLPLALNCLLLLPAIYANSNTEKPSSNLNRDKKDILDNSTTDCPAQSKMPLTTFVNKQIRPSENDQEELGRRIKAVFQKIKDILIKEKKKFNQLSSREKVLYCAIAGGPLSILILTLINKRLAYSAAIMWPLLFIGLSNYAQKT